MMRSKITRGPRIPLTLQPFYLLLFLPHKINYSSEGDCGGEISPEANELIRNKDFPPTLQCTSPFSDEIQVVPHSHFQTHEQHPGSFSVSSSFKKKSLLERLRNSVLPYQRTKAGLIFRSLP